MQKNDRCIFIIPYFGELPNYFRFFLNTCRFNKNYNWLVFTDDSTQYDYPDNVKCINISFKDFAKLVQDKFDFKISLNSPYKLCDFKPAYGYICEDYISGYKYWGHCDVDLIFGSLDTLLSRLLDQDYDKIFCLGHLVLYKNDNANNRLFMSEMDGKYWYKESFSTPEITIFDETYGNDININTIFLKNNRKVYQNDLSANFVTNRNGFVLTTYDYNTKKYVTDPDYLFFTWENGYIFGIKNYNVYIKKEFLYMHLQERKMKLSKDAITSKYIKIVPNRFVPMEYPVNENNICDIKYRYFNIHIIDYTIKWKKRALVWKIEKIKNRLAGKLWNSK